MHSTNRDQAADTDVSVRDVLKQVAGPLLVAYGLLLAMFLCPIVDSTTEPYFDQTSGVAAASYWLAQSGGKVGAPIIGLLMVFLVTSRPGITGAQRVIEFGLLFVVAVVFAGGGAAVNEHVVKPAFGVPRPFIVDLAGDDGTGPLGMSPQAFYETGDKDARRRPLRKVLDANPAPVKLSTLVRDHWIVETGYSFPSGHSYSAMFFAAFFLSIGVSFVRRTRRWLFYLLVLWAVAVCYSRPILRVHSPTDVAVGGLEGIVLGLVAFFLVRITLVRLRVRPC